MGDMNLLAVVTAAVSSFVLGGVWYSEKLFGKAWLADSGATVGDGHPAIIFGTSFLYCLVAAFAFAYIIGPAPVLSDALVMGLIVGLCFVATSFGINYQFARRSTRLLAIDGGYHTAQFLLYGLVLGLWH